VWDAARGIWNKNWATRSTAFADVSRLLPMESCWPSLPIGSILGTLDSTESTRVETAASCFGIFPPTVSYIRRRD
jgi:hypothetical protein